MSASEMLVFEIHLIFFLSEFVNLAEFVHVELPDKGRQVPVPEKLRQYFFF